MDAKTRSTKAEQLRLSRELRSEGRTWVEIASVFMHEYKVNARTAFRLARGWSQVDASTRWNDRWPSEPKTFKNFSYWEQWPSKTGHAPSLDVLGRLAELYECRLADLLVDCSDHRSRDAMHQIASDLSHISNGTTASSELATMERDDFPLDPDLAERLDAADVGELAVVTAAWSRKLGDQIDRRSVLLKLSVALTLAATMPTSELQASTHELGSEAESSDLTGIWRSDYSYISSGRGAEFNDSHFVVLRQKGQQMSVESLPHTSGSELSLNLTLRAMSLTGTWEERTSASGYYKGAIYRGALQLLVSPLGNSMTGKWIGFGKNFAINTGDWNLTLETRNTSASALRGYELAL